MDEYEYREYPEVDGIKRGSSDRLVLVQVSKDEAVKKIPEELGGAGFGGIYFLVDDVNSQIYVGETSDVNDRTKQHIKKSPVEGFDFNKIIVIWDGRTIATSHFNETTLRKALEYESIKAFKGFSSYEPVNTVSAPATLNVYQKASIEKFKSELFFLLYKFHLISELPTEVRPSEQLTHDEVKKLLERNGFQVEKTSGNQRIVMCADNVIIFYRGGSPKPQGWQVTMRDTFLDEMLSGKDGVYFLLSRTEPFLIPSKFFKENNLESKKEGLTLDFFIKEKEQKLQCHDLLLDISQFKIRI